MSWKVIMNGKEIGIVETDFASASKYWASN